MKKLFVIALLFAACKSGNRTYVNHSSSEYSVVDDTLEIQDTIVINHSGFQKIRQGDTLAKQYKTRQWNLHSPDAPVIRFDSKHAFLNNAIYTQLP
jgi:hypothetical protein